MRLICSKSRVREENSMKSLVSASGVPCEVSSLKRRKSDSCRINLIGKMRVSRCAREDFPDEGLPDTPIRRMEEGTCTAAGD